MPDDRTPVISRTSSVLPSRSNPYPNPYGSAFDPTAGRAETQRGLGGETDAQYDKRVAQEKQDKKDATSAQTKHRDRLLESELSQWGNTPVYVDGRRVQVLTVYDADGKPHQVEVLGGYRQDNQTEGFAGADPDKGLAGVGLTSAQRAQQEADRANRNATFGILGVSDLDGEQRFIMNRGPALDANGNEATSGNQDLRAGARNASQRPSSQKQQGTNYMTLAGGVTWFRNLAHNDAAAYDQLIDQLVRANYLSEADARKGVYTRAAGTAFAYAAADAAENNKSGNDTDLRTFLLTAGDSAQAAKANSYQPVNRSYQDPEYLAAVARATAQDILGRSLTDAEAAQFSARFRGLENSEYDAIDAAGRAGTGASFVDPNANGQAEAFVRAPQYDTERARQLTGGYMDALLKLIGG